VTFAEKCLKLNDVNANGLRGIAALNVTVCHFLGAFLPSTLHNTYPEVFPENLNPSFWFQVATWPPLTVFFNGHFAVLVFFVLSGYVLTLPYYLEGGDWKIKLKQRIAARYLRLAIPIASAVLISFLFYYFDLYYNKTAGDLSGSTTWFSNFYSEKVTFISFLTEALLFLKITLVPPLWSLKIEFLGSLYLLLIFIYNPKSYILLYCISIFCLIYLLHQETSILFFAIFVGSVLKPLIKFNKYRNVLFCIGVYFGIFQTNSIFHYFLPDLIVFGHQVWGEKNFYNTIGAACVTLSVIQGFGARIFGSAIADRIGQISFSLYLLHFVVLSSLTALIYLHLPQTSIFLLLNFLIYMSVCLICAVLFERTVDRSAIVYSRKFSHFVLGRPWRWMFRRP
jgi:peptidoglycan/LPS O-acetylase OafA/YrhL